MPEGPFGLPRLTSLGPLVEREEVQPAVDVEPGKYGIDMIKSVQRQTAVDSIFFLARGQPGDVRDIIELEAVFEYKQVSLGELITDTDFSSTLAKYVEMPPDEVESLIKGKSIPESDRVDLCAWLEFDSGEGSLESCSEKVGEDIRRVEDINEKIRSQRVYFPPTTFPIGSDEGDTIDGAHRIVALASILGTEASIMVWELQNVGEVINRIDERIGM